MCNPTLTTTRLDIQKAIEYIVNAKREGRPIVPFIGTGVSVESGIPTTEGLIRYLAKLRAYIKRRVYLHFGSLGERDPLSGHHDPFTNTLARFVEEHGWPDLFQLNEDLWFHEWKEWEVRINALPRPYLLERVAADQLDEFARDIYPEKAGALVELLERNRISPLGNSSLLPPPRGEVWDLCGNWKDLLRHVTGHDRDLAAALLARFTAGRRPALSHRFLGFLARVLGLRLFFTTTYDELLERALDLERIPYRIFPLEEDGRFPNPSVLRESTAVIRVDGNNHRALFDERLDVPLNDEARDRFLRILPENCLLLILGVGAHADRVLQLTRTALTTRSNSRRTALWLHYENALPSRVQKLLPEGRLSARVEHVGLFLSHLYSALYSRHPESSRDAPYLAHPSRPVGLRVPARDPKKNSEWGRVYSNEANTFFLFTNVDDLTATTFWPPRAIPPASDRLADFVNRQQGLTPIWVDLEEQYTLAGVVGSIIDQCRAYDSHLAPAVLPIEEPSDGECTAPKEDAGINRVVHALRRHRYLLVLDAVEAYLWAPTIHHGLLDVKPEQPDSLHAGTVLENHLKALVGFIANLKERVHELAGSIICVSVNWPQPRRFPHNPNEHADYCAEWGWFRVIRDHVNDLIRSGREKPALRAGDPFYDPPNCPPLDQFGDLTPAMFFVPAPQEVVACLKRFNLNADLAQKRGSLALTYLACFRRTRNLVAMHSLLRPLVPPPNQTSETGDCYTNVDLLLKAFQEANYLTPVAGGGFWMNGLLRDRVYSLNSSCGSTKNIVDCLRHVHELSPERRATYEVALPQLLYLALLHYQIGRYYFADNFHKSGDFFAFFEYLYHRVSGVRYLTRFLLMLYHRPVSVQFDPWWGEFRELLWSFLHDPNKPDDQSPATLTTKSDFDKLLEGTLKRRVEEIRALCNCLVRTRTMLQARVPAEQLIYWCDFLLEDDLPRFQCAYYMDQINKRPRDEKAPGLNFLHEQDVGIFEDYGRLRDLLHDIVARSRRERGDAEGCMRRRYLQARILTEEEWGIKAPLAMQEKQLSLPQTMQQWLEAFGRHSQWAVYSEHRLRLLDWYLDIAACLSESVSPRDKLDSVKLREIQELIGKIVTAIGTEPSGDPVQRYLWLRANLFLARLQLKVIDYWGFDHLVPGDFFTNDQVVKVRKVVGRIAELALDRVRQLAYVPDRPEMGDVYDLFRSVFRIVAGRAAWLGGPESFHDAYLEFERGRGASEGDDRLVPARVELAAAECALVNAEEEMARMIDNNSDNVAQCLTRAQVKYEVAAAYLQRAYDHLLHSRRNAVWWKFYYQLLAQYSARFNLWMLFWILQNPRSQARGDTLPDGDPGVDVWAARIYAGLRKGLQTVRMGLDYSLPQASDQGATDPWLLRIYCELYYSSVPFVSARKALNSPPGSRGRDKLWKSWRWLHETAGLKGRLPPVDPTSEKLPDNIKEAMIGTLNDLRKLGMIASHLRLDVPQFKPEKLRQLGFGAPPTLADVRRKVLASARDLATRLNAPSSVSPPPGSAS